MQHRFVFVVAGVHRCVCNRFDLDIHRGQQRDGKCNSDTNASKRAAIRIELNLIATLQLAR